MLETLTIQKKDTGSHDVDLFAENGVHLELHYKLASSRDVWRNILEKVWDYTENYTGYRYLLTQEMFYFYHIAHMAGHFRVGGCGVRSFLDLYLMRKYNQYDERILAGLLKEGGLASFNNAVVKVADCWFGGGERTELVVEIESYVLYAGMYGDMQNRVAVAKIENGGKWKFLFFRIFLPYEKLKFQYPKLQKWPILYPFYVVKRWFKLLRKDSRKKSLKELKEATQGDTKKQEFIAKLLKDLDL